MNEFLEQFLIESRELIGQATDDLLALEHNPKDAARFDSAFRAIHTLKGAAGIMDFDAMARLSHAAEDVLGAVQSGAREMTPALVTDCLGCLDQIVAWLTSMEASEALPEAAESEADVVIARLAPGTVPAVGPGRAFSAPDAPGQSGISTYAAEILHEQIELLALPQDEGATGRAAAAAAVIQNILQQGDITAQPVQKAAIPIQSAANDADAGNDATAAARPMRTDMARIDALMRLSGELVVVKNALGHAVEQALAAGLEKQQGQNLVKVCSQLGRLTADLLHASVAARVQPLRQVFQRFPRLVREMAASLNKKIRLVTEGDATEADRLIVEALFEPLLHVLRNAVDHGVEPAEKREAFGKPIPAIIRISAARVGEEVVIEITDDGRGIDVQAIRATAAARGIATQEALAAMPEEALLELIFAPGFSTAGTVSNLSGRGVGMDSVRAVISGLGGRVAIDSAPGEGTSIRFYLPFTVLLTQVLNVEAGGQAFGIPFEAVVETLQLGQEDVAKLGAAETVLWRGQTLPLFDLAQALNLPEVAPDEILHVVIVDHAGAFSALKVDRFGRRIEVMLKPLDGLLAGVQNIAGTALLGDGRVLIVLELQELLK